MSAAHTPTPWTEDEGFIFEGDIVGGHQANGLYEPGHQICNGPRLAERKANAAYIVKCVNAHDELVEALTENLSAFCEIERASLPGETRDVLNRVITAARVALVKAQS